MYVREAYALYSSLYANIDIYVYRACVLYKYIIHILYNIYIYIFIFIYMLYTGDIR